MTTAVRAPRPMLGPRVTSVVLPGVGHIIPEEAPDAVVDHVRTHLRG